MNCPACAKPIERGKVLFCMPCFAVLPHKEQADLRSLYVRLCRRLPTLEAVAKSLEPKVAKLVRTIAERRARLAARP